MFKHLLRQSILAISSDDYDRKLIYNFSLPLRNKKYTI